LATGSEDRTAKVWETATGRELLTLKGHENWILSAAWSPDGKRLASAGQSVQVYAMDIELLMSLARSRVARNLTLEECRKYLHLDEVPPIPFSEASKIL
jgi:WD40 repeat protein